MIPFTANMPSVIVVILAILNILTTYAAAIIVRENLYIWLIATGTMGSVLLIFPIFFLPRILRFRDTPAIGTFLRMMRDPVARLAPHDDVRCAIFRPSLFRKRLIEVVICTGAGLERRKDKYMNVSQGVAGKAYRTKKTSYVPIIAGSWREQLMRSLGFTEGEVNKFKPDRGSYLSIPIIKKSNQAEVSAVVCLDSNSDGTFTNDMIIEMERVAAYIADVL